MSKNYQIRLKLVLDLTTQHFRLKLPNNTDVEKKFVCIKEITSKHLNKMTSVDESGELVGHQFHCDIDNCGRWVDKICLQHPLVFIKEKRPCEAIYSALDTVPEFFYVAPSTIPNAGLGVFTRIPLPVGLAFGPYAGFLSYSKRNSEYNWEIYRFDWEVLNVNAKKMLFSNWMRYVNCPRWEEEQNFMACFYYGKFYYYTYKPVSAGSELMIWYGERYATENLSIPIDYDAGYSDNGMAPKRVQKH